MIWIFPAYVYLPMLIDMNIIQHQKLMVADVRERPLVSQRPAQKFDVGRYQGAKRCLNFENHVGLNNIEYLFLLSYKHDYIESSI